MAMRSVVVTSLGILIAVFMAGIAQAGDPYAVGEKWVYRHEGAVPMRPPDFTISGDRTREVMEIKGEGEAKRWMIQELWGSGDEWAGKRAVSADRMYDRIESGEDRVSNVKPAYPYELMGLKPDEEKKFESEFQFGEDWKFPIVMTAKRVKDETVKVPAGEFENCIHVVYEETATFTGQDGNEMKITTKREQWLHPKVNGLVKEIYTAQGPNGETDKGTSELKSYAKEKKE